jgi:hypothetical protein
MNEEEKKNLEEEINDKEAQDPGDFLKPKVGAAYKEFVSQKEIPGTPSFIAHQLMENFNEEKKKDAEDFISKTLMPADLVAYVIECAKSDPEAYQEFQKEIEKRRQKVSRS